MPVVTDKQISFQIEELYEKALEKSSKKHYRTATSDLLKPVSNTIQPPMIISSPHEHHLSVDQDRDRERELGREEVSYSGVDQTALASSKDATADIVLRDVSQSAELPQHEEEPLRSQHKRTESKHSGSSKLPKGNSTKKEKELQEAAFALYSELKRNMRDRNLTQFEQTVKQARKVAKTNKIGRTQLCLINALADLKEHDGKNLLHLAASIAAHDSKDDTTRYFKKLIDDLRFPLYHLDDNNDYPPFLLCGVKPDAEFLTCYYAMIDAGFDLNYPNPDGLTFLQKLVITAPNLTLQKITGILKTKPEISRQDLQQLDAKVALSWVRTQNPVVKQVMNALKQYVEFLEENTE